MMLIDVDMRGIYILQDFSQWRWRSIRWIGGMAAGQCGNVTAANQSHLAKSPIAGLDEHPRHGAVAGGTIDRLESRP